MIILLATIALTLQVVGLVASYEVVTGIDHSIYSFFLNLAMIVMWVLFYVMTLKIRKLEGGRSETISDPDDDPETMYGFR